MENFWKDVKYGLRALAKSPGFTVVIVLTLGLGIGANTAVFSVVNSILLRPLPVPAPEQLVVVGVTHEGNDDPHSISYLDYLDYKAQSDVFSELAGFTINFVGLSADNRADRITISYVTPDYFPMLGIQATAGRLLLPTEGVKEGTDPVMVLGHSFWQKRFGGDPGVINKVVSVNGEPFTIVGVVPEAFHGTYVLVEFDAYLPLAMAARIPEYRQIFARRDEHDLRIIGRLKPGANLEQARASLEVIAQRLEAEYPDTNRTVKPHVFPETAARPEPQGAKQNPLVVGLFLALSGLVLLVACVNVANLLLVRATLRQKELAIRAALGAGRGRLIRQLLTESLLLALCGGLTGAVIGRWVSGLLAGIRLPGDLPFRFDFGFDWRVFAYVAGVATLTGVVAGLVPAFRASRTDMNETLREGGRAQASGGGRHRARNALVVAQVAGSLVLLIAAGLFTRSLGNARQVDLGFRADHVLLLSMDVAQQGYDEARGRAFFTEVERRVRALPGVEAASFAYSVPMGYYNMSEYLHVEGREVSPGERRPVAGYNLVGPDYFSILRIPILRGRGLIEQDNQAARPVAVVNEFMARRLWPDQEPIGKRFSLSGPQGPYVEVVGVSKNGKYRWIFEDIDMYFFLPLAQKYRSLRALHVRTTVPPQTLATVVQQEIRSLDASLPVYDVMTLEQALEGGNGFFLLRWGALIAAVLGMLGLVLAVVGVYGVVSYAASQRTHEVGVRMALGARRSDILRLIVGQGLLLVGIGVVFGLGLALAASRAIANLLFGLSAHDPITFGGVTLLLAVVALVACWIPAMRATRVDPVVALRYE